MQNAFKRIFTGTLFFVITIVLAVVGYVWFGWTLLEAIYMVVITIFGVGYGEVKPLETPEQKIFTILVIIAGTSSAVYIVGGFVQMVTEGEIKRAFQEKRKAQTIASLRNHVIICGFGRMGQVLARQLWEADQPFVVVDSNLERINSALAQDYLACEGNASDENLLQRLGIDRANTLATVLPDDASNVFITLTARELNPSLIILARGEIPSTEKKLRLAGANHVVLPATISALRMASLITQPTALDFLNRTEERSYVNELLSQVDVQLDDLAIPVQSPLVGKTIRELELRGKGTFLIVALRRQDGTILVHPNPSQILGPGDALVILGRQGKIPQFRQRYEMGGQLHYRSRS
jgi:voltage-gated potassium channel